MNDDVGAARHPRNAWLTATAGFLGHIVGTALIFVVLALAAAALGYVSKYLESLGVSSIMRTGLSFVSYAIYVVDVIVFVLVLVAGAVRYVRQLLEDLK